MSYIDDEEVKMGDADEEEMDELDLDDPIDPVDDDLVAGADDLEDEEVESFAGLDGSEY